MKRILFVCTGNTCRSPMAQGMFHTLANKEGLQVETRSAGVFASDGTPISPHAASLLREKGFEEQMSSNRLTSELVTWADLILTMTMGHKQHVAMQHPDAVGKVYTLKEYVQSRSETDETQQEREQAISELQIKMALGQALTEEEMKQWEQFQQSAPDYDIADPFGGSTEQYRYCADEIEQWLQKLIEQLKNEP